jgi:hypothetical protein
MNPNEETNMKVQREFWWVLVVAAVPMVVALTALVLKACL